MPRPDAIEAADVLAVIRAHIGRQNAINWRDIANRLGHHERSAYREVQRCVQSLRRDGHLILAAVDSRDGPMGYYLPTNVEEWKAGSGGLVSRALDMLKTSSAMDKAAARRWGLPETLRPAVQLELGL